MAILLNSNGETVTLPTVLPALNGPHKGHHFRLEAIVMRDGVHHVRATRPLRGGRHVVHAHPSVFGLIVQEVISAMRHALNTLYHWWQRVDDGLFMGALALIPLAVFEAYHGGEATRHLIEMMFNSRANGGGGGH